jgi:hypothetical protein
VTHRLTTQTQAQTQSMRPSATSVSHECGREEQSVPAYVHHTDTEVDHRDTETQTQTQTRM